MKTCVFWEVGRCSSVAGCAVGEWKKVRLFALVPELELFERT